jgi:hypothetical protein
MTALQLTVRNWGRAARSIDGAWAAIAVLLAVLAITVPAQAERSLIFLGEAFLGVLPFLVASIGIAAYAKASGADNLIAQAFRGNPLMMVGLAAAMGALSPFCSCGVIPLIAALLAMGVPLAPVMAFWLASPLMDPSMFFLTVGTLGVGFAVAKTVAAFSIGAFGGVGMLALDRLGLFDNPLRAGIGDGGCGGGKIRAPAPVHWKFWDAPDRRAAFGSATLDSFLFLGKWLALAFLLESLMVAWLPAETVARFLGGEGWLTVALATIVGVPAYLNGYAALPLVAELIGQGMAPGAGMAFLLAGGVTSIPAAIAVFALARLPVFAAYVGFAFLGAFSAGLAFGLI